MNVILLVLVGETFSIESFDYYIFFICPQLIVFDYSLACNSYIAVECYSCTTNCNTGTGYRKDRNKIYATCGSNQNYCYVRYFLKVKHNINI